jgi:hypothetical protein
VSITPRHPNSLLDADDEDDQLAAQQYAARLAQRRYQMERLIYVDGVYPEHTAWYKALKTGLKQTIAAVEGAATDGTDDDPIACAALVERLAADVAELEAFDTSIQEITTWLAGVDDDDLDDVKARYAKWQAVVVEQRTWFTEMHAIYADVLAALNVSTEATRELQQLDAESS